jgi:hypothetical protein
MAIKRSLCALFFGLIALTIPMVVKAQQMPANSADLDRLFAAKSLALGPLLSLPATSLGEQLNLKWLQAKIEATDNIELNQFYYRELWRVGSALPAAEGAPLKQKSATMLLYTFIAGAIDGAACRDPSVAGGVGEALIFGAKDIWTYMGGQPDAARAKLLSAAFVLEARTSGLRGKDNVLCAGPSGFLPSSDAESAMTHARANMSTAMPALLDKLASMKSQTPN